MTRPTPRATRLVRAADLSAFREAVVRLATEGTPLDARDRMVVVPTHAAAAHLLRSIEDELLTMPGRALVVPELTASRELIAGLGARLPTPPSVLSGAEREALLELTCRTVRDRGIDPPFRLRPGLVAEVLRFYDDLNRRQNSVDDFERRALATLEPGAATDRGAERLVRQTRFLAAAFRDFERHVIDHGGDEHTLRAHLLSERCPRPFRHVVLAVVDEAFDPYGLSPSDWDLLARIPDLERLDLVVTDTMLAGALHERLHRMLPGIEEIRYEPVHPKSRPLLLVPPGGGFLHVARDREEEVAGFARRVKAAVRRADVSSPDRIALVVRQPLPYVYVAREVLRSAGVPCQMFDALPLAAEPYTAALDLVLSCAASDFARAPSMALLRSPHLRLAEARDVAALDRALAEAGYLGGAGALEALLERWRQAPARWTERAVRAGERLLEAARELHALRSAAPAAEHLSVLIAFLTGHQAPPPEEDHLRARHLRARSAILAMLSALRDAHARFNSLPVEADEVAALVRRWIESQTFAPRAGDRGVHLTDGDSARFGRFEYVHIAGAVEGEWPEPAHRSIFYSAAILRELGWPSDSDRLAGTRAAFADLLRLPSSRVSVSAFALEADALVASSPLIDEVELSGLDAVEEVVSPHRIFDYEALCLDPAALEPLGPHAREWAERRFRSTSLPQNRYRGFTAPPPSRPYSVSALERYQDCPFKFFAADVLGLEESPEDESTLSPRSRGRFVHEVFQRFFQAWESRGGGSIATERLDEARALMVEVAEPLLARLPEADAALERTRLFGSAISMGSLDVVLEHEATRSADVQERWLERRFEGEFGLGSSAGRRASLRGVADRVDLLVGNRLRVIDYKSGGAPNPARALQASIYALCAQELVQARDLQPWAIEEAAYLAFSGRRSYVPVVSAESSGGGDALNRGRERLFALLDGIARGSFPPNPHDRMICDYCPWAAVCRKEYAHG